MKLVIKSPSDKSPQFMSYSIPLEPIAWMRSGVSRNRFYDRQHKEKLDYALLLGSQHQGKPLFKGALDLQVTFYMPIAASMPKKSKVSLEGNYHRSRPDLDNSLKFLLDAATGVLFDDDCTIVSITCKKVYSSKPRTEFSLSVVE